jgi:hypothetical protein
MVCATGHLDRNAARETNLKGEQQRQYRPCPDRRAIEKIEENLYQAHPSIVQLRHKKSDITMVPLVRTRSSCQSPQE